MIYRAMATLGMMYPARGGLVWGQMREVLSEVRCLHPPRGFCITYCWGRCSPAHETEECDKVQ